MASEVREFSGRSMKSFDFERIIMGHQMANLLPKRAAMEENNPTVTATKGKQNIQPRTLTQSKSKLSVIPAKLLKVDGLLKIHKPPINEDFIKRSFQIMAKDHLQKVTESDTIQAIQSILKKCQQLPKDLKQDPKTLEMKILQIVRTEVQQIEMRIQTNIQLQQLLEEQRKNRPKKRNGRMPIKLKENAISRLLDYLSEDDIFNQMDTIEMLRSTLNNNKLNEDENNNPLLSPEGSKSSISSEDVEVPEKHEPTNNKQLLEDLVKWKNTLVDMMKRM